MKTIIKILLVSLVFLPKLSKAQENKETGVQYLGTKDNVVETRNVARFDSAAEFPLTDTSKHPARPGRLTSFNGTPYWWNGVFWARISGDTSHFSGQVNSDWNATSGVAFILNKPVLAAVATSGSYTDLSNKPTIPAAQVNSDWNATSGVSQILNKVRMIDSIWKVPGEDSFRIRVRNNDNTFRSFALVDSIGAGGGSSGTVSVVSINNLPPIFGATIANASTTPAISFTLSNAAAHSWFGNPTGSTGAPGYNLLTVADLPNSIPVSKTLLTATTGIVLTTNTLTADTSGVLATNYKVSLKQNQLSGTGYVKFAGTTPSYLTPTQVTADLNLFTTSLQGVVPASGGGTTAFLRADGTWAIPPGGGGGGAQTISGDATGTISGTNIPVVLATVNSTVISSSTLVKQIINGKGLTTNAVAANATDITTILGFVPFGPADTITKLATKFDLLKLDTLPIAAAPSSGSAPISIFGRNDTLYGKRIINAVQNNDSSLTVGNVIAANNLSDLANKNSALNNLLPNQGGNSGKILSTDGTNTSWITNSGGSGVTNISVFQTATGDSIRSSTGTTGFLPLGNHSLAGAISPGELQRLDSTLNIANTKVGDTLGYLNLTQDTLFLKGMNVTSTGSTMVITKNHTQQSLSYNTELNLSHSNNWLATTTFPALNATSTVTFSGTTYQGSNGKLDYIIQDTTTGILYRTPYIPIDTTGKANGFVLTWNSGSGKATFVSPGTGGTLTNFTAGNATPLFTTSVATSTTTPNLTFTISNAAANTVYTNQTGSSAAPSFSQPILAGSLFNNQGTTTTVLHGNAAGNPTWGAVNLTSDITGALPAANAGVPAGGSSLQVLEKNSSTNYDYAWANTVNSISGTTNQVIASSSTGNVTLSLPQNINNTATPTFGALTLQTGDLLLSRTDQPFANITRPNVTGDKSINFSVVGGGNLDAITIQSLLTTISGALTVNNNVIVSGNGSFGGTVNFATPAAGGPSIVLPAGAAPTTPPDGAMYHVNGHLYFRDNSSSTTYDLLAASSAITSINGLVGPAITLATGGAGTDFNISSGSNTVTINIPDAGSAARGLVNAGTQSINGTKTFINAPILTTSSVVGQVWTATNTSGSGAWQTPVNIYTSNGTLSSNRIVFTGGNNLILANDTTNSTAPEIPKNALIQYVNSTTSGNVDNTTVVTYQNAATTGIIESMGAQTHANNSTGTIASAYGYHGGTEMTGAGTLTNGRGGDFGTIVFGTGTITEADGVYTHPGEIVGSTAGTIVTGIGLKIDSSRRGINPGSTFTNKYAILQVGSLDSNVFNGPMRFTAGSPGVNKVFTSDANGVGSWGLVLQSSTYTPTLSASTNVNSVTLTSATYTRMGNIVTVYVNGTLTVSAANTVTLFSISLPFAAANLTQGNYGSGEVDQNTQGNGGVPATIDGGVSTNFATFRARPTSTAVLAFTCSFQYTM